MPEYIRRGVRSGHLIALASTDGVCVVEINQSAGRKTPGRFLKSLVGTGTRLAPADLPAVALNPTTVWLTDVWGAAAVHRLPQEILPASLSDLGAREFLSTVGFPCVTGSGHSATHSARDRAIRRRGPGHGIAVTGALGSTAAEDADRR
ncbi:hypothetical protein EJ357_46485 [Streptomyces cyaneochromogenes]|uniref:Uncharacterized protein n=1 Tax=Streptomyces cyaneochromogenes TaxID=2496836 RepID=A0A3S9ML62_9ACTN|nr:hypothetical protein [Streptomyces cyaneochromogenes]AZQ39944.1 hypothetical protein EJ357_46485 [Streptomyces cyaneochromogenes]